MDVVVAIDSFKGSLSSIEVATAIKEGILKVFSNASINIVPMADGGEGTIEAITLNDKSKFIYMKSCDPFRREIDSYYAALDDIVVIEVATTIGLSLVKNNLNPLEASSYGVGLQIKDALSKGYKKFIVGLGGSSTNDGGMGMLEALGYEFYDSNNHKLSGKASNLAKISHISTSNVVKEFFEAEFTVASDVENPLCGTNGATYIFGKQKGIKDSEFSVIDKGMSNYADKTANLLGLDLRNISGAGAAGGLGFAFIAYARAKVESGINLILRAINFTKIIENAEYVITGEGCLDKQTVMGKAPLGVATLAKQLGKKVLLLAGSIIKDYDNYNEFGFDAYFPVVRGVSTLAQALDKTNAYQNVKDTVEQIFRLIKLEKGE